MLMDKQNQSAQLVTEIVTRLEQMAEEHRSFVGKFKKYSQTMTEVN